jgi:glucokinase
VRSKETNKIIFTKEKLVKRYAIGIDLGGTNLKGVVMDRAGECRHLMRVPTEAEKGGPKLLENILGMIGKLLDKEGKSDSIIGVGIGTPGFVDAEGTVIGGAKNLPGWEGTNLYTPIRQRFGLPATAGNDVTVGTLAEWRYGAGLGVQNVACFMLGTGIGGGIVTNGQLYKGTYGMAGELGHMSVEANGRQCNCGIRGCVERYASAPGIVQTAIEVSRSLVKGKETPFSKLVVSEPESITSKIVYDYVKMNDPAAIMVNEMTCEKLARAVGLMVNALSPDRVILGGGVMMAGQGIVDTVSKYVPKNCWKDLWQRCELVIAKCGENAGVIGAAQLVFEDIADNIR